MNHFRHFFQLFLKKNIVKKFLNLLIDILGYICQVIFFYTIKEFISNLFYNLIGYPNYNVDKNIQKYIEVETIANKLLNKNYDNLE